MNFFKDEENEDLKKKYMGTYSIGSITKYITFYEIIKEEMVNTHLQYLAQTKKMNLVFTGGVLEIFTQRITYFDLTRLV